MTRFCENQSLAIYSRPTGWEESPQNSGEKFWYFEFKYLWFLGSLFWDWRLDREIL